MPEALPRRAAAQVILSCVIAATVGCGNSRRLDDGDDAGEIADGGNPGQAVDAAPPPPGPEPLGRRSEERTLRLIDGCIGVGVGETATFDFRYRHERGPLELVLLLDATASGTPLLNALRRGLQDELRSGLLARFPGLRVGVGIFSDFPTPPYGLVLDVPFMRLTPLATDPDDAIIALEGIRRRAGLDREEAPVEALYQTATNRGNRYVVPARCPAVVGPEDRPPVGAFCANGGDDHDLAAVLFTDAPPHNGPGGSAPYDPEIVAGAHDYDTTVAAMEAAGFRPLFLVPEDVEDVYRTFARDMGAVDASGEPVLLRFPPVGDDDDLAAWGDALVADLVAALDRGIHAVDGAMDLVLVPSALRGDEVVLDWVSGIEAVAVVPDGRARPRDDPPGFDDVRAGAEITFRVRLSIPADLPDDARGSYGLSLRLRRRLPPGDDEGPRLTPVRQRDFLVYAGAPGYCEDGRVR